MAKRTDDLMLPLILIGAAILITIVFGADLFKRLRS